MEMSNDCLNCGTLVDDSKFCPQCGQKVQLKFRHLSFFQLATSGLQQLFQVDNKFFKTFIALLFAPGKLAKEYMNGRIGTYLNPFSIFLVALLISLFFDNNILGNSLSYFTSKPIIADIIKEKIENHPYGEEHFRGVFEERTNGISKLSYLILAFFFALILGLIFLKKHLKLAYHYINAIHIISAILFIISPIIFWAFDAVEDIKNTNSTITFGFVPFVLVSLVYIGFNFSRAYNLKWYWSVAITPLFFLIFLALIIVFQNFNCWLTLLTM